MLDIFNTEPFKVVQLADAINKLEFVPGRIAEGGIFDSDGVNTVDIAIEEKTQMITLIPRTPRGAPGTTVGRTNRTLRKLGIPHHQVDDAIWADAVQGCRDFGTEEGVMDFMALVNERAGEHSQNFAVTEEYSQLGAIKGTIAYADGGTLNLFTEFNVNQLAEIDFDLDNANPADGVLRKKCAGVIRSIAAEAKGLPWSGTARAFCGDNFFDDLLAHKEVRDTFKNWPEAQILREGYIEPNGKSYGAFEFGGIVWENYRGAVGNTPMVDTDKCHIFPIAAPGIFFRTRYAPADYIETVNKKGQRLYVKGMTMRNDKGYDLEIQTNPIHYCRLPRVLIQGKRT
ncbi:MAG TPA: major capsid protein [Rhizomicrobium sp.]